ncbi:MAG: hypothetical protein HC925_01355 [Coleofasciculaceae cyanobacterium SM2_3_26]|nr:hypothetical protein [Coleofasciculaceae cyanobacterium SM2_3_26]
MRRRAIAKKVIETELFPFLSVLACTIGTLIMMIIAISSQQIGAQQQVKIVARTEAGANQTKVPRYIECRVDGVVIHPSQEFIPIQSINQPGSPLSQLIAQMSLQRDREYLIVAVRPDGIEVFKQVRQLVEQQGIDIGYEPLDAGWELDIEP